jgi:D-3-phosphoglycerate dehydrogenase
MKVLVTATSFKPDNPTPALKRLQGFIDADKIVFNPLGRPLSEDELIPLLKDCDGYIAGLDFVTGRVIDACDKLKVISRYGAGVDRVDIAAAKAKNIVVCNTPGVNAQAVADLAMGLVLCVARKLPLLDRKTKEGRWVRSTGVELFGKTLGVLGLGAAGKAVAKRAQGFSMKVLAYDPYVDASYAEVNGIAVSDFDRLIRESDVVSLHLPLNEKTRHILDGGAMRAMKRGAILINTARGGLIDERVACELLRSGHLGGLGLDAYEEEPPRPAFLSDLFEMDNVVLTPHTGAHTAEAIAEMANFSVQNLIDVLSGKDCPNVL